MAIYNIIPCILLIVVLIIFGLDRLAKSRKSNNQSNTTVEPTTAKRTTWLLYISIAFIIALWTVFGALFFLAVVWVLRMNPSSDTSFALSNNEKKTARRVYTWLFLSPIVTVPVFIGMLINISYSSATTNEWTLTALIPLIIHVPLLLGLTSKSAFVYRHTQQGILLIAVRAGLAILAAINVENHIDIALLLFFFGNGALWFFGSLAGWNQISNEKCWFMQRKGEKILLPEATEQTNPVQAHEQFNRSRQQSNNNPKLMALNNALSAFRHGNKNSRQAAIETLNALGEVEKF